MNRLLIYPVFSVLLYSLHFTIVNDLGESSHQAAEKAVMAAQVERAQERAREQARLDEKLADLKFRGNQIKLRYAAAMMDDDIEAVRQCLVEAQQLCRETR